jgi:hypothetical protein
LPVFLRGAKEALKPGGLLLYCDHYAGDGKNPDLFPAVEAQPAALREAGFSQIRCCLDLGGMALFSALH